MRTAMIRMVLASAVLLGLASCAGDDPVGDDPAADGDDHSEFTFGEPADASEADRVIEILAKDNFTFEPESIDIAVGEIITFRVTNEGLIPHDFTLGDAETQEEHAVEMAEMAGMAMEDEPNGFGIEPGETKELTWHFTEAGALLIGCHVPGHYDAGMKADISVNA